MNPEQETVELTAGLKRQGADPATEPETAVARLREMRARQQVSDLALASMLERITSHGAADLLAEIAAQAHGAPRRAAKRALFKLRQRGLGSQKPRPAAAGSLTGDAEAIATPLTTREKSSPNTLNNPDSSLSAFLSPFDSEGTRLVWLLKDFPQGGVRRLWGVASRHRGLLAIMAGRLPRRQLREERTEVERESGLRLVEADASLADFILCEAYRRTAASERVAVGNFLQVRAEFTGAAVPAEIDHPVYRELAGEPHAAPSPALLEEPVMAAFRLSKAEIQSFVNEIEQMRQSPLVLSPALEQERVAQIADRALKHALDGERGEFARRYLEDSAYYLALAGRKEAARWAFAAAKMLAQNDDVRAVAFFRAWIQSSLGAGMTQAAQQKDESPRLIVTPAEVRRASATAGRRQR